MQVPGFLVRQSPTARRNGMTELLDGTAYAPEELAANLREIRLINRGLGWTTSTLALIEKMVITSGLHDFSFLDVATGSADLPMAFMRHAKRRGWTVRVMALDSSPAVLTVARRHIGTAPVTLHRGDARALPFADHSIDIVTCVLALHHFPPHDAALLVRELARVARHAWLLVDVERSLLSYCGALALRVLLRSRLTRHDAPASVLRAYTLPELRELLERSGIRADYCGSRMPFRLVAYGSRSTACGQHGS